MSPVYPNSFHILYSRITIEKVKYCCVNMFLTAAVWCQLQAVRSCLLITMVISPQFGGKRVYLFTLSSNQLDPFASELMKHPLSSMPQHHATCDTMPLTLSPLIVTQLLQTTPHHSWPISDGYFMAFMQMVTNRYMWFICCPTEFMCSL